MRRCFALAIVCLTRALFACDTPHGLALSDLRYVPDCAFNTAAVAVNENGAFAAWHYTHAGFGFVTGSNYGVPLDIDGHSLVAEEIHYGGLTTLPAVATDGHDFLLAMSDAFNTSALIVHADGTPSATRTFATNGTAGRPGAVWTGSEYLVVSPNLKAATVSRDGAIGIVNTLTTGATLVALTSRLLIVKRGTTIETAIINGTSLSSPMRLDAVPSTASIGVGSNGSGFLVAFFEQSGRLAAQRLNANGGPIGAPIEIAKEAAADVLPQQVPQVVAEDDTYLVIWATANAIRGMRVTSSGGTTTPFAIGSGYLWSAAASQKSTIIAYGTGCGSIATRTIARGAREAGEESIVSMRPSDQTRPRLNAMTFGHQAIWFEGNDLFTRFIANNGIRGDAVRLGSGTTLNAAMIAFNGGSAIAWSDDALHIARFDAFGNATGEAKTIASTKIIFSISLAAAANEILVITQGEPDLFMNEVDAVRVDANLNTLQRALLSNPGDDGFDPVGAGDGAHWVVAWRNSASQLVAIEMPRGDLRSQTRTSRMLPTTGVSFIGDVTSGDDPAVVWSDFTHPHATFIHSGLDVLLGPGNASNPHVIDGHVFWKESGGNTRILSAPLTNAPGEAPRERGCVASAIFPIEYDVRNGDVDAIAFPDGPQVRIQLKMFPRRHATRP
jgi:hypothetical protein